MRRKYNPATTAKPAPIELNGVVGKVKEGFNSALAKYKEGKTEVVKATEEIVAE